jgi:hypothetical protein
MRLHVATNVPSSEVLCVAIFTFERFVRMVVKLVWPGAARPTSRGVAGSRRAGFHHTVGDPAIVADG